MRDKFATAASGTIVINDTTEKVAQFSAYYVASDSVIASIEVDDDTATNVVSTYVTTPANNVPAGTLITPVLSHKFFSAITLTSGAVVGIK
jgi:hypothetical protein